MSNFNFGSLASTPVANNTKYLKPYNIYDNVSIESIEIKTGTTSEGREWKSFDVKYVCEDGVFSDKTFFPNPEDSQDTERKEFDTSNGGKRKNPSKCEIFMAKVAAIGNAFNPEGFKKMQAASSKFKSFDDVVNALISIINKAEGSTTSMKLIGKTSQDGRVYAKLPNPLGLKVEKDGTENLFPISMFGDNLTFTAYESQKKQELENAKPTAVDTEIQKGVDEDTSDIDFESLL